MTNTPYRSQQRSQGAPPAAPPHPGDRPERRFAGFPPGSLAFTAVPDVFFSELLCTIDSLAELKVTLHVIWLLHRRRGGRPWVSHAELAADGVLLRGLATEGEPPLQTLEVGLTGALARGTLLRLRSADAGGQDALYVLNSARGRETVEAVRRGLLTLPASAPVVEDRPLPEKPNIFALYEQNIGPLQPLIAEQLEEAQNTYSSDWVEDAFRIAAENNARNWRYVRAILERWRRQGKDSSDQGEARSRKRYISGEYEEYKRS